MENLYKDKEYMDNLLKSLAYEINELEMVSVHNNDKFSFQLSDMKAALNEIKLTVEKENNDK